MSHKWNGRLLSLAEEVASWSKDRSTKVGCVIVDNNRNILSTGYNGFPRGIDDNVDERHERPIKYLYTEHAERNAIYAAARNGVKLEGSTIYVPWLPCADCTRAIIQSGIQKIVTMELEKDDPKAARWAESHGVTLEMLEESDVELVYHNPKETE